jgi:CMP-N,N'-diacetyllegionaminic acid synthase
MMNILITFCARGGSKGVPGKNIKNLSGIPLIAYSIETARKFSEIFGNNCILSLSTDDEEILHVARNYDVKTDYIRPSYLATDAAGKVDTLRHLLDYEEQNRNLSFDYVLDLDVSSPLRSVKDLILAFNRIIEDPAAYNIFSVSKAHRNPYFNMVEENKDGYYKLVKTTENNVFSRQKAPRVFDLNASFYIYRKAFFKNSFKSVFTEKTLIYEVPHICFDIDNLVDFEIMEFLISNDKLGFDL